MVKKIGTIIAVLSFFFSAVAQNIEGVNARIDAMGGCGVIDDIGWTINHPASIYKNANQIQGSWCAMDISGIGNTFGALIAITKLTDNLFAGVTFNNRMMMPSHFYQNGALFTNSLRMNPGDNANDYPNLPRLNLCFKLNDAVQLGAGAFFEQTSNSIDETRTIAYTPAGDTAQLRVPYNYKQDVSVSDNGAMLEARVTAGSITFFPFIRAGFPRVGGTESSDRLTKLKESLTARPAPDSMTDADIDYTYGGAEGLYLNGGSHVWTDIGKTTLIAGVFYTQKSYQFKKTITRSIEKLAPDASNSSIIESKSGQDSLGLNYNTKLVEWWLAAAPTYSDGFFISPEYDGGVELYSPHDPNMTPSSDTSITRAYHNIRVCVEKKSKNVWFFDDISFRCGFVAAWTSEKRHITGISGGQTPESNETLPLKSYLWGSDWNYKESKITAGLGLHKGRGTFDFSCNLQNWRKGMGLISGPPLALATFTVDFGPSK